MADEQSVGFLHMLSGAAMTIGGTALGFVTGTKVKLARLEDRMAEAEKDIDTVQTENKEFRRSYYNERDVFVEAARRAERNGAKIESLEREIQSKLDQIISHLAQRGSQ